MIDDEVTKRIERIWASLDKINLLMDDLKNMRVNGESYNEYKAKSVVASEPAKPFLRILR